MTKFESVGVSFQQNAYTVEYANKMFQYSCNCCCCKGMQLKCDRCAIRINHELVVAALQTMKDYPVNNDRSEEVFDNTEVFVDDLAGA